MQYTRYSKGIYLLIYLLDFIFLSFLFFYFLNIQYKKQETITYLLEFHYKALILFYFSWFFISINTKLYEINRAGGIIIILKKCFSQIIFFSIIVFGVSGFKTHELYSNILSIRFLTNLFCFIFLSRIFIFLFLKLYRFLGGNFRNIIFVDENSNTLSLIKLLKKRKDYGYVNYGHFIEKREDTINTINKKQYSFNLNKLKTFLKDNKIQVIFISLNGNLSQETHDKLILLAQKLHIEVRFIPSSIELFNNLKFEYYDSFPILTFNKFPLDHLWNQFFKRIFDIIFSLFIIIFFLSWLFPIIAIAIYLDSGTPILYTQKRIGFKSKTFKCLKFRTMKHSKDNDIKSTIKGDERITKIGEILRKTSLDELPQFFNVLKGNMSVVGPRPHMVVQDEYYNDLLVKYSLRHYVKPGITGLAQIKGFRGEINSKEDMIRRIIADISYVKNWSFLLDIIIITQTGIKVLVGDKKAI